MNGEYGFLFDLSLLKLILNLVNGKALLTVLGKLIKIWRILGKDAQRDLRHKDIFRVMFR